jgi:fructoselysine 6-kinase
MAVTVATVGDNCVDRYTTPVSQTLAGGNALNVAVGLAGAGFQSHYLGAVGDDDDGRTVTTAAQRAGVAIDRVKVLPLPTGVTLVELDAERDRRFVEERPGASGAYQPGPDDIEFLRTCRWVHCANLTDPAALISQLDGVDVSYDFSQGNETLMADLAPKLKIAFVSGAGGRDSSLTTARAAVDAGAATAVVTRGRNGSLAWNHAGVEVAAAPANVVDTLGAGDALIAAVIGTTIAGGEIREALEAGSVAAARVCSHYGAWEQP